MDDCFAVGPASTTLSEFQATKDVFDPLGTSLSDGEEVPPCASMLLLGAMVSLQGDTVFSSLPERKLVDRRGILGIVLRTGRLTPSAAAKLRGKLGFAQSVIFGLFGRSVLNDFSARQYSRNLPGRSPLTDAIQETLEWWLAVAPSEPTKAVSCRFLPFAAVYTDAQ